MSRGDAQSGNTSKQYAPDHCNYPV
jgi:hypothetical protein